MWESRFPTEPMVRTRLTAKEPGLGLVETQLEIGNSLENLMENSMGNSKASLWEIRLQLDSQSEVPREVPGVDLFQPAMATESESQLEKTWVQQTESKWEHRSGSKWG